jgi:hypothetical protein
MTAETRAGAAPARRGLVAGVVVGGALSPAPPCRGLLATRPKIDLPRAPRRGHRRRRRPRRRPSARRRRLRRSYARAATGLQDNDGQRAPRLHALRALANIKDGDASAEYWALLSRAWSSS